MKDTSTNQYVTRSIGLLVLRIGFSAYLMTHGWGKLQMILQGRMGAFSDPIGIGSAPSLILVTFAEFVCALLVLIGLGTRLAAIPIVIAMGVAAFVSHASDPWTMAEAASLFRSGAAKSWSSKQPALMYLFAFLTLIFTGAGKFSIDHIIASRRRPGRRSR
jgi:putative oxidoreductase